MVDRDAWYGSLVENAVSAVARDLLTGALQRLERAGYRWCCMSMRSRHRDIGEVDHEQEFLQLMLELPDWAAGLPVAAKPWRGKRYAKDHHDGAEAR